jgi:hypothetical protein
MQQLYSWTCTDAIMTRRPTMVSSTIVVMIRRPLRRHDSSSSSSSSSSSRRLSSFQERCIQAIISNWKVSGVNENSPTMWLLCQQNPLILGRILSSTTDGAKGVSHEMQNFNGYYKSLLDDRESLKQCNDHVRACLDSQEQENAALKRKYALLEKAHGALQPKHNILEKSHEFLKRCGEIYDWTCNATKCFFLYMLAMVRSALQKCLDSILGKYKTRLARYVREKTKMRFQPISSV